ncbi:hypothetical protein ACHAPU_011099 [Fusarium lateritium]
MATQAAIKHPLGTLGDNINNKRCLRLPKPAYFDISALIDQYRGTPRRLVQRQRMYTCGKMIPFEKSTEKKRSSTTLTEMIANIEKVGSENPFINGVMQAKDQLMLLGYAVRRVAEIEVEKDWLSNGPEMATGATQ